MVHRCLAISAYETVKERNREDYNDLQKMWEEDPQMAANAMVFGMSYDQRQQVSEDTKAKTLSTTGFRLKNTSIQGERRVDSPPQGEDLPS